MRARRRREKKANSSAKQGGEAGLDPTLPERPDFLFLFFFFLIFLGLHPWHMEVPRLGVKSELQLSAYTTAAATPDPSCICDRHHSSGQHQILNPLREASCFLAGFVSAVLQRELQCFQIF